MTQDQWYRKLRSFVPSWVFEKEHYSVALFNAIAAVFAASEVDSTDQFDETFLTRAQDPALDAEGAERNIGRLLGEADSFYAHRIQRITSETDRTSIETLVNELLLVPPCIILESPFDRPYVHRTTFCSRANYIIGGDRNYFVVVIPKQVHVPYTFVSRGFDYPASGGNFCSRRGFVGDEDLTPELFKVIITAIDRTKALGVMYSVVEKF